MNSLRDINGVKMKYTTEHDIIAQLETTLMTLDEHAETLESQKRHIENDLRMQIEIKAEDKASGLSNEKKRQIAYEEIADCNEELQGIISELRDIRHEHRFIKIELGNEGRAYALKVGGVSL